MLTSSQSRRQFLRFSSLTAGALALGGLLEACGGGSPAASPSTPAGSPSAASKPASSVAAAPASASASTVSSRKLILSWGAPVGSFAPLWMADAIHAYQKHGLSVDIRYVATNEAVAALIARSLDVLEVSPAPIITADVNGHEDLVLIASALNHPILGLYVESSITNAEQLKGKIIGSDRPATPVDYAARLTLSLLGLKPTDVQLRPLGGGPEQLAALIAGQVQAAVLAPPQSFDAEAKGYRLLKDIFSQPYQNIGLFASRSRFKELGPQMPGLLAAYKEGIDAFNQQPDLAMNVLKQYTKTNDQSVLKKTYDFYRKTAPFEPSLQPTMEGLQAMIDFLAATVPAAKNTKANQFVDLRFLSQLPKS